jgi:hypothetical protein
MATNPWEAIGAFSLSYTAPAATAAVTISSPTAGISAEAISVSPEVGLFIRQWFRSFVDQLSQVDQLALAFSSFRVDVLTTEDSPPLFVLAKAEDDTFTFADLSRFSMGKGIDHSSPVPTQATVEEGIDHLFTQKGLGDLTLLGDSVLTQTHFVIPSLPELVGVSEQRRAILGKAIEEPLPLEDFFSRVLTIYRSFAETLSLEDVALASNVVDRFITEDAASFSFSGGTSDDALIEDSPSLRPGKLTSDFFSFSELTLFGHGKSHFDTLPFSDSISLTNTFERSFSDAFALDDLATLGGVVKDTQATKLNVFGLGDSQTLTFGKAPFDELVLIEGFARVVSFSRQEAEGLTLLEDVQIYKRSLNSSLLNSSALNTSALNA